VDVDAATQHGIPVGNTPGVLTEITARMAVALTFAAARSVGEAEKSPDLVDLENVVFVPHIVSAACWTRQGMATRAAGNVAVILMDYPTWQRPDILLFLEGDAPKAAPSILNAEALEILKYEESING
jgi:lactate dehydrogenase-like 2-hydroxyacid dehydrogenase